MITVEPMDVSRYPKVREYLVLLMRGQREPCARKREAIGNEITEKLDTLSADEKDLAVAILDETTGNGRMN